MRASGLRRNTESAVHLISDAALANFFEVYLPVSAPLLSETRLPRFPDQGRLFGGSFDLLFRFALSDVWRPRL